MSTPVPTPAPTPLEAAKNDVLWSGFAFGLVVLFIPVSLTIMSVIPQPAPTLGDRRFVAAAVIALMLIFAGIRLLFSLIRLHRARSESSTRSNEA